MPERQVVPAKRRSYRPERRLCPRCGRTLQRSHIAWRKGLIYSIGVEQVTSWAYRCPEPGCENRAAVYLSQAAEGLHLKHRRYSRELIVKSVTSGFGITARCTNCTSG